MRNKRDIRVSIYITKEEQIELANNFKIDLPITTQTQLKKFASCIRSAALNKKISYKTTHPIAREQFIELARLSSNLNQLMHAYNCEKIINLEEANALVKAIRNKLINITNNHESKD